MKIVHHSIVLLTLLAFLFTACEEEIILDNELIAPKLVINSFIQPDSLISVKIYRNIPINSSVLSTEIANATVVLYEDGIKKEQLKMHSTIYEQMDYNNPGELIVDTLYRYVSENTYAAFDKKYKIEVSQSGFETTSTETTIPKPVEIISIDTFTVYKIEEWWTSMNYHFKLRFKDPAEEANYYRIVIKEKKFSKDLRL
jgi:hypothetical protein